MSGPWVITGLVLGLIAVVFALMSLLPWGAGAAVLRTDFPATRYIPVWDIEWNDTLDVTIDERGRLWSGAAQVPDLSVALRSFRSESERRHTEDGRTNVWYGSLRVYVHRNTRWAEIHVLCVAAIDAGFRRVALRSRAQPGNEIAWLKLEFCGPALAGELPPDDFPSYVEELHSAKRLTLRSTDLSQAERQRELLLRERSAAGEYRYNEPIVDVQLPPDLSAQEAFSLLECFVGRVSGGVRVVGFTR